MVAGRTPNRVLVAETLQGRMRRQGRLPGDQGAEVLLGYLLQVGRVGEATVENCHQHIREIPL